MGGLGMDDLVIKKMGMGVSVVLHVWLYNKAVSVNISFTAYKIKIIILAACIYTFGLIRPHLVHHAVPLSNISANTTDYLITFLYFMVHRGFTSISFCSCS